MKEIIGENNLFDIIRMVVHYISSILMVLSMCAVLLIYISLYIIHRSKNYEYILARVKD